MSDSKQDKPDKDANDKAKKMSGKEFRDYTENLKKNKPRVFKIYLEGKKETKHRLPNPDDGKKIIRDKSIRIPHEDVGGLCHERARVCIAGASKSAKTFLAQDLAIKLCTGQNWLGHKINKKHRVLHLNMEVSREWFKDRLERIEEKNDHALPEDALTVFHFREEYFSLEETFDDLSKEFEPGMFDWIICDPIYAMFGKLSEMNPGDMQEFCNQLKRLSNNLNAGIIAFHHFPKGNAAGKNSIDRMGGSGILGRWFDAVVSMTKHQEEDCQVLSYDLRNSIKTDPKVIRFKYPIYELDESLSPLDLDTGSGGTKKGSKEADMSKYTPQAIYSCFPRTWTRVKDIPALMKIKSGVSKLDAKAWLDKWLTETLNKDGKPIAQLQFEDSEVITDHWCCNYRSGSLQFKAR